MATSDILILLIFTYAYTVCKNVKIFQSQIGPFNYLFDNNTFYFCVSLLASLNVCLLLSYYVIYIMFLCLFLCSCCY